MIRFLLSVSVSIVLLTAGCEKPVGAPDESAGTTQDLPASGIEIRDARVQLFPGMGAAYLRVLNADEREDRLVRVETAAAESVDSHETLAEDGVMRMRPRPNGFEIPARGELRLEPGAKHLMLIEPKIEDGQTEVELVLVFERHEPIRIQAPILGAGGAVHDDPSH